MEQVLDWLNENELRSYPIIEGTSKTLTGETSTLELPDNFLLDLQLLITSFRLSQENGTSVPIFLKKLKYTNSLDIVFGTATATVETFTITSPEEETFPLYIRTPAGNLAVFGTGVTELLTAGNNQPFEVYGDISVEPSTCSQFDAAWLGVKSLSATPEKVSKNALDVGIVRSYEPVLPLIDMPEATKLTGDVRFLEGYNFRVNISNSLIDLEIGASFGLNMNCSTSFLQEEYLDCSELISYINGVPPDTTGNFKLNPGTNISIVSGNTLQPFNDPLTESANTHTLFVGLTFQSTDLCAPVNILPATT